MCGEDEDAKEDEFEYLVVVVVIIIMTKQLVCFCSFRIGCRGVVITIIITTTHMAFPSCIFLLNIKLVLCINPSMIPTTLYTPPTMAINVVMNW